MVKEFLKRVLIMGLLGFLLNGCVDANNLQGIDKTDAFISKFSNKNVKIKDSHYNISFGEFGFFYNHNKDILTLRVYIAKTYWDILDKEQKQNIKKVMQTLNSAKTREIYNMGGGYFEHDKNIEKPMIFLKKDYFLSSIDYDTFESDVSNLINLGGVWVIRWFSEVTGIAHGWNKYPKEKQLR
jgi:hypothetical protein